MITKNDQIYIGEQWYPIKSAAFDIASATADIVAAVADKILLAVGIEFAVDTDGTTFKLNDGTADLHAAQVFMRGGGKVNYPGDRGLWRTQAVNRPIKGISAGGKVTGTLWYIEL